jgi:hypothetical protein
MLLIKILAILAVSSCAFSADAYVVLNAETGQDIGTNIIRDDRGAFTFKGDLMGGSKCGVVYRHDAESPTSETYLMNENGAAVIGCTKIRPEYPKDDSLITEKIVPQIAQYKKFGHGFYTGESRQEHGRLIVWEKNVAAELTSPNDLTFAINSNGFSPEKTGQIRIDRHFVKDGFYLQAITFSKGSDSEISFAETLNSRIVDEILAEAAP